MSVSEKSLRMSVSNEREKGVSQMSGFQDIVGHKQIIEHLKNAEKLNKVSHAYIFSGEKLSNSAVSLGVLCLGIFRRNRCRLEEKTGVIKNR